MINGWGYDKRAKSKTARGPVNWHTRRDSNPRPSGSKPPAPILITPSKSITYDCVLSHTYVLVGAFESAKYGNL